MLYPQPLITGDTIMLISTARKIDVEQLDCVLKTFYDWGLEVIKGTHLMNSFHQFAGTDAERAYDLQNALNNSNCKAVFCFRGGYGTVRIIEKIDFSPLLKNPKWIVGYSDITVLHNALHNIGVASLHATMPVNYKSSSNESLSSLKNSLFGRPNRYVFESHFFNKLGETKGVLVGGNLSMLLSLSGTQYDIDTKGKILVLEDLDEYLYNIDRMMWNLKLGGKLAFLKGLIIGGFTDMKDNKVPFGKKAYEIILDVISEYNFPVCFNFPFGHINDNRSLILGKEAQMKVSQNEVVFFQ